MPSNTVFSGTKILVTGAAGFVGMHVCRALAKQGATIIGIDNFNDYYDPALKRARIDILESNSNFTIHETDIANDVFVRDLFKKEKPDYCVHLAAQAGVRYSIENPFAYERSNLAGHLSILEACRHTPSIKHLVYASSSSVYGHRASPPSGFSEEDSVTKPVSLYAATKLSCEHMSESYANLFGFPQTGLRFFTVYGPWGRPDMAYFKFAELDRKGQSIDVYGQGKMARDFTYIDDVVAGVLGVIKRPPNMNTQRILNIGSDHPIPLMEMISTLEKLLAKTFDKNFLPMQPGDVSSTHANIDKINELMGYRPQTEFEDGLREFVDWYKFWTSSDKFVPPKCDAEPLVILSSASS